MQCILLYNTWTFLSKRIIKRSFIKVAFKHVPRGGGKKKWLKDQKKELFFFIFGKNQKKFIFTLLPPSPIPSLKSRYVPDCVTEFMRKIYASVGIIYLPQILLLTCVCFLIMEEDVRENYQSNTFKRWENIDSKHWKFLLFKIMYPNEPRHDWKASIYVPIPYDCNTLVFILKLNVRDIHEP